MTEKLDKVREQIALKYYESAYLGGWFGNTWEQLIENDPKKKQECYDFVDDLYSIPIPVEPERECDCADGERIVGGMGVECPTCKGTRRIPSKVMTIAQIISERIEGCEEIPDNSR